MLSSLDPSAQQFLNELNRIGDRMGRAQRQVTTGRRVTQLSDAPEAVPLILAARANGSTNQQILSNLGRVKAEADAGEQALQSAVQILEQVQFPYPVAPLVRAHHEKWDGTGYPAGLKGNAIPLGARILAAVDCLDALISDRYHRRALTIDQAMEHLQSESGKSFDPAVVAVIASRFRELEDRVRAARQDVPRSKRILEIKPDFLEEDDHEHDEHEHVRDQPMQA